MSLSAASAVAELRIICGPTGAGKSAIAMALAERHGLTLVSADSRQIYRGFDIGTAKPTAADRARVPHVGIDVADPSERWSAARWADDAERAIHEVGAAHTLVVGGTGLYLKALLTPLFNAPPLDPTARASLDSVLSTLSVDELRRWCRSLDPALAELGRTQLLRAIETALLTGERLSELQARLARPPRFRAQWLVVDPGHALASQLEQRLDSMLAGGWPDEVRQLEATVPPDAPAWNACGYSAVRKMMHGDCTPAEAREAILVSTRQYAKRQRTWFRHQLEGQPVVRLDPALSSAVGLADTWWRTGDFS